MRTPEEDRREARYEARRDEALERFHDADEAEHGPRCECGGYVKTPDGPWWCRGECEGDDIVADNARQSDYFRRLTDRGIDPYAPATD